MSASQPSQPFEETQILVRRAMAGDKASFGHLLDLIGPRLLDRIRLMMGPAAREAAESGDFLNGVFVDLLEDWKRYEITSDRQLLALATQIARNSIRDELRRRRERAFTAFSASETFSGQPKPEGQTQVPAIDNEDCQRLAEALESLSEDHRQVIEWRHFDHLPFSKIATLMGRSANAVQLLHARAVAGLGARLREPGSGD